MYKIEKSCYNKRVTIIFIGKKYLKNTNRYLSV